MIHSMKLAILAAASVLVSACFANAKPDWQSGTFALENATPQISSSMSALAMQDGRTVIEVVQKAKHKTLRRYDRDQTKLMHLVLIEDDFNGFLHLHPALGSDGHFRIATRLGKGHGYYAYAESVPAGGTKQVFRFRVGDPRDVRRRSLPVNRTSAVSGYEVALSQDRIKADVPTTITATITQGGKAVTGLHPYLGAVAHAVFVNMESLTYVHVHPMSETMGDMGHEETLPPDAKVSGMMMLMVPALRAGTYRMWLQFRGANGLVAAPFTVEAM